MKPVDIADSITDDGEGRNRKNMDWDNSEPDDIRWFLQKLYDRPNVGDTTSEVMTAAQTENKISLYLDEIRNNGFTNLNDLFETKDSLLEKLNIPSIADKSRLINKIGSKRITSYMRFRYAIFMFICILAIAVDITLLAFNSLIVVGLGGDVTGGDGDKKRHNGVDHDASLSGNGTDTDSIMDPVLLAYYIFLFHMIEFTVPFLYDTIMQFIFNRSFKYKLTAIIRQFSLIFAALTSGIAALLVYISLAAYENEAHYLEYSSFLFILILDLVQLYRKNRGFRMYYTLYGRRRFIMRHWKAILTLIVTFISMVGVIVVIILRYYNYEWITHYVEFSVNIMVVISTYLSNDIRQIK